MSSESDSAFASIDSAFVSTILSFLGVTTGGRERTGGGGATARGRAGGGGGLFWTDGGTARARGGDGGRPFWTAEGSALDHDFLPSSFAVPPSRSLKKSVMRMPSLFATSSSQILLR